MNCRWGHGGQGAGTALTKWRTSPPAPAKPAFLLWSARSARAQAVERVRGSAGPAPPPRAAVGRAQERQAPSSRLLLHPPDLPVARVQPAPPAAAADRAGHVRTHVLVLVHRDPEVVAQVPVDR